MAVRHRVRRVRQERVERVAGGRGAGRVEGQRPARAEVEALRLDVLDRRPRGPPAPAIGARFERQRLRQVELAPVLQEEREERRLDLVAEVLPGGAVERDGPELVPRSAAPPAVIPGPDDEEVQVVRIVLLERRVDRERPVEVLLVPPSRHVERRDPDLAEVRHHRLPLPEGVVVRVRDEVVPRRDLPVEVLRVHVRERAEREVPVVGVVPREAELLELLRALELERVLERVAQPEGPVVVEVVAEPHVGRRGLRRDRPERGVRLEGAHDRGPALVGDAEHPDPAVVAGQVLHQPVDRVPGVRALVERLRVPGRARGALHDEDALRAELSADVLEREDVPVFRERLQVRLEVAGGVLDAVGRAQQDDRQRPGRLLRREDLRVQPDAVAHRDHGVRHPEAAVGRDRLGLGRAAARARGREREQARGERPADPGTQRPPCAHRVSLLRRGRCRPRPRWPRRRSARPRRATTARAPIRRRRSRGPVLRAGFTEVFVTGMLTRWISVSARPIGMPREAGRRALVRRAEDHDQEHEGHHDLADERRMERVAARRMLAVAVGGEPAREVEARLAARDQVEDARSRDRRRAPGRRRRAAAPRPGIAFRPRARRSPRG